MEALKLQQIASLEAKANWTTWKFKVQVALKGIPNGLNVVDGKLKAPKKPQEGSSKDVIVAYEKEMAMYEKADNNALMLLINSMNEDTLLKVMRFNTAYDVWQELHRLME